MTGTQRGPLLAVTSGAVAIDLATKVAAVRWLSQSVDVTSFLTLRVVRNPGIAFGLGADLPPWVLLTVTGAAVVALFVAAFRGLLPGALPAGLIVGGGLANLVDRIRDGSVVDLFDLGWWPVFNLADMFLTAGVAWLLVASFLSDGRDDDRRAVDRDGGGSAAPMHVRRP